MDNQQKVNPTTRRPDDPPSQRPADPTTRRSADIPGAGRLLGVDWGEKRIGVSVSDPSRTVAQPLETLVRRAGRRFPMRQFRDYVARYEPAGVVVGLPLESDGSEGESAGAARALGEQIASVTGLPVVYIDERMTTSRVQQAIREMKGKTRGREPDVDRLAAMILLQAWLDTNRS